MSIAENIHTVKEKMAAAAQRAGRSLDDCQLLVVSKTWPADIVAEAGAEHPLLGESKLQEAEVKIAELDDSISWHYIGHVQRNKVRKILPLFDVIHAVDSLKLARYTSNVAGELGIKAKVFIQINQGAEESKHGFSEGDLRTQLAELMQLENLDIQGLMSIPPASENAEGARAWFRQLRELRDELNQLDGVALPLLSMGMSHDYEIAIEEGSNIVRVGSAIFGSRHYPTA
ncbi:YggS family pyridoxal phosphate-dependent enzyme [Persicirhabdus sediminis]|uniref:Pyridoxal phosphate homeostasis protein n=1 Tax=Persicirhabdus sediminis TaxID=454144 RepID=A0A8J7MEA9_9BACT|nr:YggS family pyridoxal phosphate-dependent enzyme [Persicirhabdus sediminis]MBK1791153.1 YggS family pyridoxal phosphate-dependent enzyme [Persicirhabdus sediminis]